MVIATTTVQKPTKQFLDLLKLSKQYDWKIIVSGDLSTPHSAYQELEGLNLEYLTPEIQDKAWKKLSDLVGFKTIQRRNFSIIKAYQENDPRIMLWDDDNGPIMDIFGKNIYVNQEVDIDLYSHRQGETVFDPLAPTNHNDLWHRGFPLDKLETKNNLDYLGKQKREVLIQADLWDSNPDIDGILRLIKKPLVKFNITSPYGFTGTSPFNSQNTIISRKILPKYSVLPFLGRYDDIIQSYLTQKYFANSLIYNQATVIQERNEHDVFVDLEKEITGMRYMRRFLDSDCDLKVFPMGEKILEFVNLYEECFN